MNIITTKVGSYHTNCYMVYEDTARCVLIDPGFQPEELLELVQAKGKTVEAILLTHGHFDHVGGVKKIAEQTGCRVYICQEDILLNPMLTAGPLHYTHTYKEGDVLTLAGMTFTVMQTPGHTPGCVCLLCGDTIFSGDTLFAGTCGRTDLPGSSHVEMMHSLARLAKLEKDYQVLPGHGNSSTIFQEKRCNPFMQGL